MPDGNIKTCDAYKHLNAACCDDCHTAYPHYDMKLIDLPDGGKAWVCHRMEWAIFPERYAEHLAWLRDSPEGKMLREAFGDDDRLEN
jgi:hypothetical protein